MGILAKGENLTKKPREAVTEVANGHCYLALTYMNMDMQMQIPKCVYPTPNTY